MLNGNRLGASIDPIVVATTRAKSELVLCQERNLSVYQYILTHFENWSFIERLLQQKEENITFLLLLKQFSINDQFSKWAKLLPIWFKLSLLNIFWAWCECFHILMYWHHEYGKTENIDTVRLLVIIFKFSNEVGLQKLICFSFEI